MKKILSFFGYSIVGLTAPLAADCGSCCEPYCGSSSCYPSECCYDPCCTSWDGGDAPWGGFYIGGFGGYAWGRGDVTTSGIASILFNGTRKLDTKGALAGGLVGWNYQWCDHVVGIEADFAWSDIKGSSFDTSSLGSIILPITTATTMSMQQRFLGTARVKLGYNWCNTLFYGTGGFAYGDTKYEANFVVTIVDVTVSQTLSSTKIRAGWTVGGGIEKMLGCSWSVKVEYLYFDFGRTHLSDNFINNRWKNQIHTLKGGINYHF